MSTVAGKSLKIITPAAVSGGGASSNKNESEARKGH